MTFAPWLEVPKSPLFVTGSKPQSHILKLGNVENNAGKIQRLHGAKLCDAEDRADQVQSEVEDLEGKVPLSHEI